MRMKRRTFLQGCCAGIAAMSGARLTNLTFAQTPGSPQRCIVTIFLRGGMDALNFLIPHADSLYHDARPDLSLQPSDGAYDLDGYFALHPSAGALKELYDSRHLALVAATGIPDGQGTRSHFQAQDYLEYGGQQKNEGGWLGRYLNAAPTPTQYSGIFRGISVSSSLALSMQGFGGALSMREADDFTLEGRADKTDLRRALRTMYGVDPTLGPPAMKTLDAIDLLEANPVDDYTPRPGVEYPNEDIADSLASIAQLIKLDVGLQAATVDLGGWDTHEGQAGSNPATGSFSDRVSELSDSLGAFWADIADHHGLVTVVVMTEFGRRLKENNNRGTDHGHGGVMMVLNGAIREKRVFGEWPGLANDQLYERKDLRVTTDFRTVLSEVLISQAEVDPNDIGQYFPGYTFPDPVGFLIGTPTMNTGFRVY